MASTPALPRLFGPYVLTRPLASDPLGDTYRAGTAGRAGLKPFVFLRDFSTGEVDSGALLRAMEKAVDVLDEVRGPSVAKGTVLGAVNEAPFLAVDWVSGRTLEAIFSARSAGAPLPLEHSLLIVEKLLTALETCQPLERVSGAPHGFLIPSFVLVSSEGETRLFGAGLGPGLLGSIRQPKGRRAFGPYIAPEILEGSGPSAAGDIYAAAAILLEAATGRPPPPGRAIEVVERAVLALDGTPLPEDIKRLLRRGLDPDPNRRARSAPVYRRELSSLLYGGPYSPSTFNLAFFMQRHFEKAIQEEARQMAEEEKARPAPEPAHRPVVRPPEAPAPRPVPEPTGHPPAPARTVGEPPRRGGLGGLPLWIAAGLVAVLGAAGLWLLRMRTAAPPPSPTPAPKPTPVPTPPATPTPVVVGKDDPLFVAAVQQRLAEEMKKREEKLKREEEAAARKRQAELDRAAEQAQKVEAEGAQQAAGEQSDLKEAARLAREAREARAREEAARAAKAAEIPPVKEGDLIDLDATDTPPVSLTVVRPEPTRLALQRHISGTVVVRILVDHTGRAEKIEVVRDTAPRVGLAEACQEALKKWTWTPAVKAGQKVRTWIVVQFPFRL